MLCVVYVWDSWKTPQVGPSRFQEGESTFTAFLTRGATTSGVKHFFFLTLGFSFFMHLCNEIFYVHVYIPALILLFVTGNFINEEEQKQKNKQKHLNNEYCCSALTNLLHEIEIFHIGRFFSGIQILHYGTWHIVSSLFNHSSSTFTTQQMEASEWIVEQPQKELSYWFRLSNLIVVPSYQWPHELTYVWSTYFII